MVEVTAVGAPWIEVAGDDVAKLGGNLGVARDVEAGEDPGNSG